MGGVAAPLRGLMVVLAACAAAAGPAHAAFPGPNIDFAAHDVRCMAAGGAS